MGLGLIGAIGGAGKGMMERAQRAWDREDMQLRSDIDEARESRLAKIRADLEAGLVRTRGEVDAGLQDDAQEHSSGEAALDRRQRTTLQDDAQAHTSGEAALDRGQREALQEDTQEHAARENRRNRLHAESEGQKDRESRERIAGLSGGGTQSAAWIEANRRFERTSMTTTSTGANGFPIEQDVQAIYDRDTQMTLIQQGTRFVPQGGDPIELPGDESGAVSYLIENPDLATSFLNKYNYLPMEFIQSISSSRARLPSE